MTKTTFISSKIIFLFFKKFTCSINEIWSFISEYFGNKNIKILTKMCSTLRPTCSKSSWLEPLRGLGSLTNTAPYRTEQEHKSQRKQMHFSVHVHKDVQCFWSLFPLTWTYHACSSFAFKFGHISRCLEAPQLHTESAFCLKPPEVIYI